MEHTGQRFDQVFSLGAVVVIYDYEDVGYRTTRIDSVELFRGLVNHAAQPIENGIVAAAANDCARLRLFELRIQPLVPRRLYLAVTEQLFAIHNLKVWGLPSTEFILRKALQSKAMFLSQASDET
jgi:hypothetical protein